MIKNKKPLYEVEFTSKEGNHIFILLSIVEEYNAVDRTYRYALLQTSTIFSAIHHKKLQEDNHIYFRTIDKELLELHIFNHAMTLKDKFNADLYEY